MSKRGYVLSALLMVLVMVPAPFAGAKQPLDVTIRVTVATGTFGASGPAVDAGLMCDGGTTYNPVPDKFVGKSGVVSNAQVITEFTCGEGAFEGESFIVKQQLHIDLTGEPATWTINWVVKTGSEAFENLRGNGHGTGTFLAEWPFGPYDVLEGRLH